MSSQPYLGVELSDDLSWKLHVKNIASKANRSLGLLRRNLWNCKRSVKEIAYKSLVRPRLEYASIVWDPYHRSDIDKLEMVQRQAARFVGRKYTREPGVVSNLLSELGWQSLEERRTAARLIFMYKVIHQKVAVQSDNILNPATRSTRNSSASIHTYINISTKKDCYRFSTFPVQSPSGTTYPLIHVNPSQLKFSKDIYQNST